MLDIEGRELGSFLWLFRYIGLRVFFVVWGGFLEGRFGLSR